MKKLTAVIVACLTVAAFFGGQIVESANQEASSMPDKEATVTCYKWADNGTAHVQCPDTVYAPNSVVDITVKECGEYQFVVDEPHPCPHFRNSS